MNIDQQILNYINDKWGSKEGMLALNEQYRYTPPYPTLALNDFVPADIAQKLYEESRTIPDTE